jgi:hypothetical protein
MRSFAAHVVWFDDLKRSDVSKVGGKNSSLGDPGASRDQYRSDPHAPDAAMARSRSL